jgi:hypothetical protein
MAISWDSTLLIQDYPGYTTAIVTNVEDTGPNAHSVQRAFTAESSGTFPATVTFHSVSSPFTFTVERPAQYRILGPVNPVTGKLGSVPRNVFTMRTRKGVTPLSGQAPVTMVIETKVSVPAGADAADPVNIRLALGVHAAEMNNLSTQLAEIFIDGVL